jgi:hypothetical protein
MITPQIRDESDKVYSFMYNNYTGDITFLCMAYPEEYNQYVKDNYRKSLSWATIKEEFTTFWIIMKNLEEVYETPEVMGFEINGVGSLSATDARKLVNTAVRKGLKPYYRQKKISELLK